MKKISFILCFASVAVLCLSACGSKPNNSFEKALDVVLNSDLDEMMMDADYSKQSFNLSTDFNITGYDIDANIKFATNSKQNNKDLEGEITLNSDINLSMDGGETKIHINVGNATMRYLANTVYLKLDNLIFSGFEDFMNEISYYNLSGIINQRYSIESSGDMVNEIYNLPTDFNYMKFYDEEKLDKLADNLKSCIINEGATVYNGIYSEYNGFKAWKFSINAEKLFKSFKDFSKDLLSPDELEEIEEIDMNEILKDLPLKNFKGYLVITGKDKVQVIIDNLDIENDYSTTKLYGTYGKDKYEIVIEKDNENILVLSAKLNKFHYDITMNVNGQEIMKGTIIPRKSAGGFKLNFSFIFNIKDFTEENIKIPVKGNWEWKEISKFNLEAPKDAKNLMDIYKDKYLNYYDYDYDYDYNYDYGF